MVAEVVSGIIVELLLVSKLSVFLHTSEEHNIVHFPLDFSFIVFS